MNIINLITTKNSLLKVPLQNEGFIINEFSPADDVKEIEEKIVKGKNNYTLFEIIDFKNSTPDLFLKRIRFLYDKSKLICLSETISPDLRNFFIKSGISDCITTFSPDRIALYIKSLNTKIEVKPGLFIILDDNEFHKNMFNSIIKRFGYIIRFVSTIDELFQTVKEPDNVMTLINIGAKNLDLNGLVRQSYINPDIKKNPVITYKCMEQGLFVHEIVNGLNRLTKVILSPEELFCMLLDILFKKEIISYTSTYINTLKYEKIFSFAEKPLQQIYYENHGKIIGQDSIFEKDRIDSMIYTSEMIKRTLIRAEGILWLKQSESSRNRITCGVGA